MEKKKLKFYVERIQPYLLENISGLNTFFTFLWNFFLKNVSSLVFICKKMCWMCTSKGDPVSVLLQDNHSEPQKTEMYTVNYQSYFVPQQYQPNCL